MKLRHAPASRLNARLDQQASEHLAALKTSLGLSVSDIVRASLAFYHDAMTKKKSAPLASFGKHIGKYDSGGDGTLSENYKAQIGKHLERKYSRR
jgi:hypothetical protein